MENKSGYITVVNGLGEKAQIPRAGLEKYKQLMAEFRELDRKLKGTVDSSKIYEIKEIIED